MIDRNSEPDAELRELAGLAALACGARLVALVRRAGGDAYVAGPGARGAGFDSGRVHSLQLAYATVAMHVVARVPVVREDGARLGTLLVHAREPRNLTGTQHELLAGLARLAARSLARASVRTVGAGPAAVTGGPPPAVARATDDGRRLRALARLVVRDGRRTVARLRDDVASATTGASLLLTALAGRVHVLGGRIVEDVETARAALDAATLACRQTAASSPSFVASGYTVQGALALYAAHLTRERWPACTIDVAPDVPRELRADQMLALLGVVAQAFAIGQHRHGCRHLAIGIAMRGPDEVHALIAADGEDARGDVRMRRRVEMAGLVARAAGAVVVPLAGRDGESPDAACSIVEPTVDSLVTLLRTVARAPTLGPILAVVLPLRGPQLSACRWSSASCAENALSSPGAMRSYTPSGDSTHAFVLSAR